MLAIETDRLAIELFCLREILGVALIPSQRIKSCREVIIRVWIVRISRKRLLKTGQRLVVVSGLESLLAYNIVLMRSKVAADC